MDKLLVVALSLLMPAILSAQAVLGSLTGVIRDSTQAVIPEVPVVVTNRDTGARSEGKAQPNGVYLIRQLPAGVYSVSVQAPGFKRLWVDNVTVEVGSTTTLDLKLEVGQLVETVTVTSQSSQVQTTSGDVGTTINVHQVIEMPLDSRNVFMLMNLVPGAMLRPNSDNPQNPFSAISVGGGRNQQTLSLLDGVLNSLGPVGGQTFNMAPPVEAMQEFKVQVNNLSAEYGRTVGGVVNAVTRSGTNEFHGMAYEYIRNDKFDANGWGADAKPKLRRNTYGGTIGGPLIKNKLFFFYNYDGMRNIQAGAATRSVGLPEWFEGDFSRANRQVGTSSVQVPIFDPATGSGTFESPRATLQFPGNVIPASRLDPLAVKAAAYFPAPNRTPDNPYNLGNNWQLNTRPKFRRQYHIGRIDHEITARTKIYGRYIHSPQLNTTESLPGWDIFDNATSARGLSQNLSVNFTHLFSPSFFVNVTGGMHRFRNRGAANHCCDANRGAEFGIKGLFEGRGENLPVFTFAGGGGQVPISNLGVGTNRLLAYTNLPFTAAFTKVRGSHTLLFGGAHSQHWANIIIRLDDSGNWQFDGHFTKGATATGAAVANTGLPLADFLLGRVNSVKATIQPVTTRKLLHYGAYIQDDWRVSSNLTLNLGVRWEAETSDYEVDGKRSNLNPYAVNPMAGTGDIPAGALGQFEFQGRNGKGKYIINWPKLNFAPRFGFAWRFRGTNNTVLRGGYGIFYGDLNPGGGVEWGRLGFAAALAYTNPVPFRLQDGFPSGAYVIPSESDLTPDYATRGTKFALGSIDFTNPYQNLEYAQNLNLTLQHQWRGIFLEAGYLGNLARHIPESNININQIPPELLSRTEIPERLRRPYTAYPGDQAELNLWQNAVGISNYHALTSKIERRTRTGFSWVVAYTFMKWMDNTSFMPVGAVQPAVQNIYQRVRSLSPNHSPHRLVFSPIVELPFGKGKALLNRGGVVNAVLGGWQLSTLATLQSGFPLTATVLNGARDIKGDPASVLWPHVVGDANSANQGEPAVGVRGIQWLTESAFAVPARFTLGNLGRVIPGVLSPGSINFDSMLAKSFMITEKWRAQFRWEAFNTFNTPRWGNPAVNVGGGNFGVITLPSSKRIMQFGLRISR